MRQWAGIFKGFLLITIGPLALIGAFFLIALIPQTGLALMLRAGGGSLLPPAIALALCGRIYARRADMRTSIALIAILIAYSALRHRTPWHPFDTGAGLSDTLSYNRISAAALLACAYLGYFALTWLRTCFSKS